ncbi:MAG: hypothetical protein FWG90_06495, partial [Oscillospiraceae bacterium]|nr:hypothetical protein [Oscillospiraceae bacterium]
NKMPLKEAMEKAVRDCINRNVLANFLRKNASEVINMLFNEFNMEDFGKVMRQEGRQEGALERAFIIARNLISKNIPLDIIKDTTGLSIKEIESLQKA